MRRWMSLAVLFVVSMLFAACGTIEGQVKHPFGIGEEDTEFASESAFLSSDVSITRGNTLVAFAANWGDGIGSLSTISLADIATVQLARQTTDGDDAVVRSFGGKIYVVNRYGTDTVQVIDPQDFSVTADFNVGSGSNPQDIAVISDDKAYVSRLDAQNDVGDTSDILIVDPRTGAKVGGIDLKPYTADNGDRLARAAQMVIVGKFIYVCMQDLAGDMNMSADTNGKVAVIDTDTDEVKIIPLSGWNPTEITYSPLTKKIYVVDTNYYDTSSNNGGLEVIDPATDVSEGILVKDEDLGGSVSGVVILSVDIAFTSTDGQRIASFNPKTYEVISKSIYSTLPWGINDFSIDSEGRLVIANRFSGIEFIDPSNGSTLSAPLNVGAAPGSITFVDVK